MALIACLLLTSCSASSNTTETTTPDNEENDIITSISGSVIVPQSALGGKFSLSSTDASIPLSGATVRAVDPITGKIIDEIPATTTDEGGNFTLDFSNVAISANYHVRFTAVDEADENNLLILTRDEDSEGLEADTISITQESTLVTNTIEKTKVLAVANLLGNATEIPEDKEEALRDAYSQLLRAAKEVEQEPISGVPNLRVAKPSGTSAADMTDAQIQQALAEQASKNKTVVESTIQSNTALNNSVNTAANTFEVTSETVAETLTYEEGLELLDLGETLEEPIELPNVRFPKGTSFTRSVALDDETTALPVSSNILAGFLLPSDGSVRLGEGTNLKRGAVVPDSYARKLPAQMKVEQEVELPTGATLPSGTTFEDDFEFETDKEFDYAEGFRMPSNVVFEDAFVLPSGEDVDYEEGFILPENVNLPTDMVIPKEITDFEGDREVDADIIAMFAENYIIKNEHKDNFADSLTLTDEITEILDDEFVVDTEITNKFHPSRAIKQSLLDKFDDSVVISDEMINKFHDSTKLNEDNLDQVEAITPELIEKFKPGVKIQHEHKNKLTIINNDVAALLDNDVVIEEDELTKFADDIVIHQSLLDKFDNDVTIQSDIITKFDSTTKLKSHHIHQVPTFSPEVISKFDDTAKIPYSLRDRLTEIDGSIVSKFDDDFRIDESLKDKITEIDGAVAARFDDEFKIDNSLKDRITEIDNQVSAKFDSTFTIDSDTLSKVVNIDTTIVNKLEDGVEIEASMKDKLTEITPEIADRFETGFKIDNSMRDKIRSIDSEMRDKFDTDFVFDDDSMELIPESDRDEFNELLPEEYRSAEPNEIFEAIQNNELTATHLHIYHDNGGELDAVNEMGNTFLIEAVKYGHIDMVELLASFNNNVSELNLTLSDRNSLGLSAMDYLMNTVHIKDFFFLFSDTSSLTSFYAEIYTPLREEDVIASHGRILIDFETSEFRSIAEDLFSASDSVDIVMELCTHRGHFVEGSATDNFSFVLQALEILPTFRTSDYEAQDFSGRVAQYMQVAKNDHNDVGLYRDFSAIRASIVGNGFDD